MAENQSPDVDSENPDVVADKVWGVLGPLRLFCNQLLKSDSKF